MDLGNIIMVITGLLQLGQRWSGWLQQTVHNFHVSLIRLMTSCARAASVALFTISPVPEDA